MKSGGAIVGRYFFYLFFFLEKWWGCEFIEVLCVWFIVWRGVGR